MRKMNPWVRWPLLILASPLILFGVVAWVGGLIVIFIALNAIEVAYCTIKNEPINWWSFDDVRRPNK